MSINYYAIELPTEEKIYEMQSLIAKRQLREVRRILNDEIIIYHIGHQAMGWQFLFAPHVKSRSCFWNSGRVVSPWEDSLESIKNYLSRDNVEIEDEYGKKYTCEEFFNNIVLYNDPETAINGEQYDKMHGKSYIFTEPMEYTTLDGLRFSTDEDFS